MPGKKHLRGVGPKEQREYEHIKESAEKSGRYGKRAAEVAARVVVRARPGVVAQVGIDRQPRLLAHAVSRHVRDHHAVKPVIRQLQICQHQARRCGPRNVCALERPLVAQRRRSFRRHS